MHTPTPHLFQLVLSLVQAALVWISVRAVTPVGGVHRLEFYNCSLRENLPGDIIKSNEAASLTIC